MELIAAFKVYVDVIMLSAGSKDVTEQLSSIVLSLSCNPAVYRWFRIPLFPVGSDSPSKQNDRGWIVLPLLVQWKHFALCFFLPLRLSGAQMEFSVDYTRIVENLTLAPIKLITNGCSVASWSYDAAFMPSWHMRISPLSSAQQIPHCQPNETVSCRWQSAADVSRGASLSKQLNWGHWWENEKDGCIRPTTWAAHCKNSSDMVSFHCAWVFPCCHCLAVGSLYIWEYGIDLLYTESVMRHGCINKNLLEMKVTLLLWRAKPSPRKCTSFPPPPDIRFIPSC